MSSFILKISKDQWLTRQIKTDTFSVKVQPSTTVNGRGCEEINDILKQSPVFVYAKCPVSDIKAMAMLEKKKFLLIDTNITLQKRIAGIKKSLIADNFRLAEPADEKEVVAIARRNFLFSRFHLDCAFDRKTANAIKAAWAKSYFLGERGNAMIVARHKGRIAGFLQLLIDKPQKALTIDLIAVDKPMQGKGIASAMIAFAENRFTNMKRIKVGTQIVNLPSLKLYETLGFGIDSAGYVLHYHN